MAKEDAFDPQPNGTIKFVIDGALHTLRRPKIKEFRNLREVLADIGANSIEDVEEAAAAVEKGEAGPGFKVGGTRKRRRSNGHKATCKCPICKNMKKKTRRHRKRSHRRR